MVQKSSISLGVTSNPRTWPITHGMARLPGLDLQVTNLSPSELFLRQLRDAEFDAAEMSISSLMVARSRGDDRFVALPIFTSRYFFHSLVLVRSGAGIRRPADLRGRRVGVPEYQMTGALWTRGVLADEFGVRAEELEWWIERLPQASHAGAVGFSPPPGVRINQIPAQKTIGSMMLAGELDAAVMYFPVAKASATERSTVDLSQSAEFAPLFSDPIDENRRFLGKTGIFPINHCVVVRRSSLDERPALLREVHQLFDLANDMADQERQEHIAVHVLAGVIDESARKALAPRLINHGVEPNRRTLETLARYSFEQGLTPRLVDIDAFFDGAV